MEGSTANRFGNAVDVCPAKQRPTRA
ncbi:TPA: hypothetical protein N0F65_005715 [Lagenidium giganteum]|uniref:Uncharacterized protein n=1 Tax=Lagenidium giganteum TaxID=4803 RepID=A0AAV2ZCX5_9STRA|nr:TPA: hypothetical protein N0F65_005715 [Lagenidium giganteum]